MVKTRLLFWGKKEVQLFPLNKGIIKEVANKLVSLRFHSI